MQILRSVDFSIDFPSSSFFFFLFSSRPQGETTSGAQVKLESEDPLPQSESEHAGPRRQRWMDMDDSAGGMAQQPDVAPVGAGSPWPWPAHLHVSPARRGSASGSWAHWAANLSRWCWGWGRRAGRLGLLLAESEASSWREAGMVNVSGPA